MTLDAPAWLIVLPFAALLAWRAPGLGLWQPLRALTIVLLVAALTQPRSRWGDDGRDVWVLVDRSASAAAALAPVLPEWEQLLQRGRASGDRLWFVDFAHDAVRRERGDPVFRGSLDATRLGSAIRFTVNQLDPRRPSRLLVLTDGQSTEPLDGVGEALARAQTRGVALDYRLALPPVRTDFQVESLQAAPEVEPRAAFLLEARVRGNVDGVVPWELRRDGRVLRRGELEVRGGTARVRLADRLEAEGVARYEFRVAPAEGDAHPENNYAATWVLAGGGRRVLLLTAFADDPLAGVLRAAGATVDVVTAAEALEAGRLAGVRVVVLHNTPAWKISREFLAALDFFVRGQGGGLLMAGGRGSFAAGGFFQSPIDELLPVSMELRQEHRKLAVALSIVMDRSGSMAASVDGGLTKMDLADAGAARAAQLLGDMDMISVHAVDSTAHEVIPLSMVGPNRGMIDSVVRRIASTGGGIFVYEGLQAGWRELQKADVGQRHLVLFSDAADSEEPGEYVKLLEEMRAGKTTVSVIGLGSEADVDADLLEDIAARGGGRIFFSTDAHELPEIFAQETVTIARSAFIDEPVGLAATAGWREIASQPLAWLSQVDGYNLSYLRPGATAAALSQDDYAAPLVAAWQRGAGRAAAVAFPLGGEFSERTRAWPAYADFVRTLTRWLAGEDAPPGVGLRTEIANDRLRVTLLLDDERLGAAAARGPRLAVAVAEGGAVSSRELAWERIAPGEFIATTPLPTDGFLRGGVQVGEFTLPFGPVAAQAQAEWLMLPERVQALRAVAQQSGGGERLELSEIWRTPLPPTTSDAQPWLLLAALAAFLVDALLTRLGITRWRRRRGAASAAASVGSGEGRG